MSRALVEDPMRAVLLMLALLLSPIALIPFDMNVAQAQNRCPEGHDYDWRNNRCVPNRYGGEQRRGRYDGGNPRYGRCPEGYDFTGNGCVPNVGRSRYDGGNPRFTRCPEGYDFTGNGCVPNRPSFRNRSENPQFGRCPEGFDFTPAGCVPNRR